MTTIIPITKTTTIITGGIHGIETTTTTTTTIKKKKNVLEMTPYRGGGFGATTKEEEGPVGMQLDSRGPLYLPMCGLWYFLLRWSFTEITSFENNYYNYTVDNNNR